MALYDNMDDLLKKNLLTCLKHNKLEQYLFGIYMGCLPKNSMDMRSGHCFYTAQKVYNDLNKEYLVLELDKRYVNTVIKHLTEGNFYDVDSVFESVKTQLLLEKEKKNSFNLDETALKKCYELINNILKKKRKYLEGFRNVNSDIPDGIYEYIQNNKDEVFGAILKKAK